MWPGLSGALILDMDTARKQRRRSAPPGPSQSPAVTQVLNTTKSPAPALAIKRSDTAPVTLRGWLYKQGSDGLQLWKKRWFVLSEYCLFYYKGKEVIVITFIPFYAFTQLVQNHLTSRKAKAKIDLHHYLEISRRNNDSGCNLLSGSFHLMGCITTEWHFYAVIISCIDA